MNTPSLAKAEAPGTALRPSRHPSLGPNQRTTSGRSVRLADVVLFALVGHADDRGFEFGQVVGDGGGDDRV
jgi:hypothetical protein